MVITGLGCLLPGVSSSEELWQGLRSGACHITPLDDPSMRCLAPPWFGRIDPKRDQMAQAQVPHRLARNASVQTGWGMAAAAQAMAMAGLPCGPASPGELLAGSGRLGLYTAQGEHLMQDLQPSTAPWLVRAVGREPVLKTPSILVDSSSSPSSGGP
jgi:3-oxoacyl-(acyl-carrier-protein) synthase